MNRKKLLCVLTAVLVVVNCFLLTSCGKSEQVTNVESGISAIGEVNENSLGAIEEAEKLYSGLSEKEKDKVENQDALKQARAEYDQLMSDKVIALIDSIGTVDRNSIEKIDAAKKAYDSLTENQKALVSKYSTLQQAENKYNAIVIAEVEAKIQMVQYNKEDEPSDILQEAINDAQNAYDALSAEQKAQVNNYNQLLGVIDAVSQYYIDNAQAAIDVAIDSDSGEVFQKAEELYSALSTAQKLKIKNYAEFEESYEAFKNKPPLELVSYSLKKRRTRGGELYLKAKNVSGKIIKEFSATVFAFDNDGVPVVVDFNDYYDNISYSQAIKVGEFTKSNRYWTLYGTYSEMKQIVVILKEVEFFDGTTWENEQYETLREKYEQQLLEEGDKNVLKRS